MRLAALDETRRGTARRRGATSRRRCAPTCAAAPAGSRSSRRPATRSGDDPPRATRRRRGAVAPRDAAARVVAGPGRGAGVPDLGARRGARRRRLRRRRRARRTRWSSSAPTPPLAPTVRAARAGTRTRPGPQQHGAAVPSGRAARRASGRSRCRRPGSSRPTSSPTPAGAGPAAVPASPLANGGAFGGKRRSPVPARARELADETGEAGPGAVAARGRRAARAQAPAAGHRRCAPTAPASSASAGRRARPTSGRWWRACARLCPGVEVEEVEVVGPAGVARPARRRVGRGAGGPRTRCAAEPGAGRARAGPRSRCPAPGSASVELDLDDGDAGPRRGRRVGRRDPVSGDAALLRARRGAPGARAGVERGHRGRRRRRARRPDHPLLRHPRRARHARGRRCASTRRTGGRVNGSDAVFVATLAAAWIAEGCPARWPTRRDAVRARRAAT